MNVSKSAVHLVLNPFSSDFQLEVYVGTGIVLDGATSASGTCMKWTEFLVRESMKEEDKKNKYRV
jgi:hypothetical protein